MTPDEAVAVLAAELDVVLPEELASLLYSGNDGIALDALTRNATGAPEWAEWAVRMEAHLRRRADGWATRTLWAVHEAYGRAGDLQSPDYIPGALERYGLLHVLESATTADGKPDPLSALVLADDARMGLYGGELTALAKRVARELFAGPKPDEAGSRETVTVNGRPMLRWDAGFADILEGLNGPRARALASDLRDLSADRSAKVPPLGGELWRLWARVEIGSGWGRRPRWMVALVDALWHDRWRPALVRERRPVALTVTSLGLVDRVLAGREVRPGADGREVLVDRDGRAVSRFEVRGLATAIQAEALEALARGGTRQLATVAAARFVPWFAHAVQRRPDEAAALVFEGADGVNAYGTVAAAMGMDPEKHANEVRGLLHALNCAILSYPDGGEAGVLMLDYRPGGGRGNPSRLTLTPGRPWLARDVFELPDGSEHRALAPIPLLHDLAPPFVGNRQDRGPLARLYLRILAELAHESPDIARGLGAQITGARWAELANAEELRNPGPLALAPVQARWARDGDDGPAVFERVGPDRWHLAPAFAAERAMLEEGGKQRIGASIGGKRAAKAKAEARKRLADGKRKRGR